MYLEFMGVSTSIILLILLNILYILLIFLVIREWSWYYEDISDDMKLNMVLFGCFWANIDMSHSLRVLASNIIEWIVL